MTRESGNSKRAFGRIAVTGATGFLGGHLVDYLAAHNAQVVCLCRPQSRTAGLQERGFPVRSLDMHDEAAWQEALHDVDLVFHLAAAVAASRRREFYAANTGIPAALARAAASLARPPVIVYCSSIAAAGPAPRGKIRLPGVAPTPVSVYGASKRGGEVALAEWADHFELSIVRPGILFGPRNRELFPVFDSIARTRVHFVPGFRPPLLSLLHVADACEILWQVAHKGQRVPRPHDGQPAGNLDEGIYYAVANEHWDYVQLGREVGRALGISHIRLHVPFPLPWILGAGFELAARFGPVHPPFNLDKIREATAPSWAYEDPRLEQELHVTFRKSLSARLQETADWYRQAGWLA